MGSATISAPSSSEYAQTTNLKRKSQAAEPSRSHMSSKRRRMAHDHYDSASTISAPSKEVVDLTTDDTANYVYATPTKKAKTPKAKKSDEEKRLSRYRKQPPQSFQNYYLRAMTQRMFVLSRSRPEQPSSPCPLGHAACPSEEITLAGTTGNIYTVTITHKPTCTCPDFTKGNPQCKHIVHVLAKVLKAPTELSYQLAFLTSELTTIFAVAGPLPDETVSEADKDGKRHAIEGDCAICCEDLDPANEEIVWCKAACGNNLHKTCFELWAKTKKGQQITCPYCRTPWEGDGAAELGKLKGKGKVGAEGYVNVAAELGLSGRRDYGTYHSFWVEREVRAGRIDVGDYGGY